MPRKTIHRETLINVANDQIAHITRRAIMAEISWEEADRARRGIIGLLEATLHTYDDAYAGFNYLATEITESGQLRPNYDDLARRYY